MTDHQISITVHDQFKRGDKVRLVHAEGREFVTEAAVEVERECVSITFVCVADRAQYAVIVDRVETGPCSVALERAAVTQEPTS